MKPVPSTASVPIFRELSGDECAEIFAHDLEQSIIDLLATQEFKKKALELFGKTGKFGAGAAYPVVIMIGQLRVKVYTSIEAARSREAMPPVRSHAIDIVAGEMQPDSQEVITSDRQITRVIGTDVSNAVDKARKEVGITPLVPKRDGQGLVVNSPDEHEARQVDYKDRLSKTKAKMRENREKLANDEQAAKKA